MAKKENVTFGFMLANHPNRFGFYPVMIRITKNRKTKRVKTELEVKKADWNQKAKNYRHFRNSFHNAEVFNTMLEDIIKRYRETYIDLANEGNATAENIVEKVRKGKTSASFLQYAQERAQTMYDNGNFSTWKRYNGFCNKLAAYLGSKRKHDITFAEITPAFLADYETYLHKLPNERHPEKVLHQNTIESIFRIFKAIVNRAITIDGKMKYDQNPFLKFKCVGVKTTKEKLDSKELEKLLALELEKDSLLWHCRNYFFFSFYCAGIRVGDLMQLRWCNITPEGRLFYQMGKNHKTRDLVLVPEAIEILKQYEPRKTKPTDYIFPLLNNASSWAKYVTQSEKDSMPPDMKRDYYNTLSAKNALINKELALLANAAGIEKKVSFHISRHSFAKAAKEKGIDNLILKELLAHSNLATTQRYMGEFDTATTDNALQKAVTKEDETDKVLNILQGINPDILKAALLRLEGNK